MLCHRVGIDIKKHFISLKKEVFRKTIHLCTAFVPLFLHFYRTPVIVLLFAAGILYIIAENLRIRGIEIPFVSAITAAAARKRDENKFVLGPVTLVAGCIACILLWDEPYSTVGILSLAFGDGLASLAGKTFGKIEVPFTGGKTAAGSLTCFTAIYICSFAILGNNLISMIVALTGMVIEGLPLKDYDNICIPVIIGGIAQLLLPHIQ